MSSAALRSFLLPQDEARLEYGRLLWHKAHTRERLLRHWSDARHPYAARFLDQWKPWVEKVLQSSEGCDDELDAELRAHGLSLRVVVREIPPVLGGFY